MLQDQIAADDVVHGFFAQRCLNVDYDRAVFLRDQPDGIIENLGRPEAQLVAVLGSLIIFQRGLVIFLVFVDVCLRIIGICGGIIHTQIFGLGGGRGLVITFLERSQTLLINLFPKFGVDARTHVTDKGRLVALVGGQRADQHGYVRLLILAEDILQVVVELVDARFEDRRAVGDVLVPV